MGKILPLWIEIWLVVSTIICAIDISFTMLRPHSLKDGALGSLFYFWHIYADVDIRYGSTNDLTSMATGRLMLIELVMNISAMLMDRKLSRHTLLTAFTSTVMVFWKTAIYLCLYIFPAPGNPDFIAPGTSCLKVFLVFWLPNLVWVFIPLTIIVALWNRLALPQSDRHSSQNTLISGDEVGEKSALYEKPEQREEEPTV